MPTDTVAYVRLSDLRHRAIQVQLACTFTLITTTVLFYVASHAQGVWSIVFDPIADAGDWQQLDRLARTRLVIEVAMIIINVSSDRSIHAHASEEHLLVSDQ